MRMFIKIGVLICLFFIQFCLAAEQGNKDQAMARPQIVIVSGTGPGMGNFTYGVKIYQYLKERYPENEYVSIMAGAESNRLSVEKIYGLNFEVKDNIWLDEQVINDGASSESVIKAKKEFDLKFGEIIKPGARFIFTGALGPIHDFLNDNYNIESGIDLNMVRYGPVSEDQENDFLNQIVDGMNFEIDDPHIAKRLFFPGSDGYRENYGFINYYTPAFIRPVLLWYDSTYQFGIMGGRAGIGLLLSPHQHSLAKNYNSLPSQRKLYLEKVLDTAKDAQEASIDSMLENKMLSRFLSDLTEEHKFDDKVRWLAETGDYITGYMSTESALIDFIATTIPQADSSKDLKYVINMSDIFLSEWENTDWSDSIKEFGEDAVNFIIKQIRTEQQLLWKVLADNNISKIYYRSYGRYPNRNIEINQNGGRAIWIINPFPLEHKVLEALFLASKYHFVGCTGDHSLYEAISLGKMPFRETLYHTFGFNKDLSKYAVDLGLPNCLVPDDWLGCSVSKFLYSRKWVSSLIQMIGATCNGN